MFHKSLSLALVLAAGLAFDPAAEAQWERAYGLKDTKDFGHRRVTPVTQCPGGGYISIGTWDQSGLSYVYVVRTDDFGGTIFEQYYDVGADGRPDEGLALTELKHGGWVTTGMSNRGTRWEAHAMKLDCNGRPQITNFYAVNTPSLSPYRLVGNDIRELYTGDGVTTNGLDLAIAGYLESVNGVEVRRHPAAPGPEPQPDLASPFRPRRRRALLRPDRAASDLPPHRRHRGGRRIRRHLRPAPGAGGPHRRRWNGVLGLFPTSAWRSTATAATNSFDSIVETQTWPDTGNLTMAGSPTRRAWTTTSTWCRPSPTRAACWRR